MLNAALRSVHSVYQLAHYRFSLAVNYSNSNLLSVPNLRAIDGIK